MIKLCIIYPHIIKILQILSNKIRIALFFIIFNLVTMVTTFINLNIYISGKNMKTRPLKRLITVSDICFFNLITLLLHFCNFRVRISFCRHGNNRCLETANYSHYMQNKTFVSTLLSIMTHSQ